MSKSVPNLNTEPTEDQLCLLGFNHVKGIGAVRMQALISFFGSASQAWKANSNELRQAGLSDKIIEHFIEVRQRLSLPKVWDQLAKQGIKVITWDADHYPRRLKEIAQPPPVLYCRGSLLPQDDWAVAVVGTRRASAYGRRAAEELSAILAQNGITVVSGLARGIDSIAHQSALTNNGRTLAVFGCGIDRIYPPENRRLAERIIQQGGLLSDYPPGTPPDANNFPPRNRIISGISMAVAVVEAGQTSGALITAKFAADQGRDVFAFPGNVFSPSSKGANQLIADGAYPLLEPKEILSALQLENTPSYQQAQKILPDNPMEEKIISLLGTEPMHIDELQAKSGIPIETLSANLIMMELKGLVQQSGGMNYVTRT